MTHAPGQWVVKSLSVYTDYGAGHRHKVADTRQPLFTRECQEANARLIAAAPELLAALQDVADYWAGGDIPADIYAGMRAAIAKATGGQP
jgi:hypothetical protein